MRLAGLALATLASAVGAQVPCGDSRAAAAVADQVRGAAFGLVAADPALSGAVRGASAKVPITLAAVRTVAHAGALQQCQAILRIGTPPAVRDRFTEPGAGMVLGPAGLAVADSGIAGAVNYTVQPSDDGRSLWVEVARLQPIGTALAFALAAVAGPTQPARDASPSSAYAAPPPPAPPRGPCADLDMATAAGTQACALRAAEAAEADLTQEFALALADENAKAQARMRANQDQWSARRDARCQAAADPLRCRTEEARKRIQQLRY